MLRCEVRKDGAEHRGAAGPMVCAAKLSNALCLLQEVSVVAGGWIPCSTHRCFVGWSGAQLSSVQRCSLVDPGRSREGEHPSGKGALIMGRLSGRAWGGEWNCWKGTADKWDFVIYRALGLAIKQGEKGSLFMGNRIRAGAKGEVRGKEVPRTCDSTKGTPPAPGGHRAAPIPPARAGCAPEAARPPLKAMGE